MEENLCIGEKYYENVSELNHEFQLSAETLPDIVLIDIFNYLRFWEICKSGEVCKRWYELSRVVLKTLKIVDISGIYLTHHQFEKLIPNLPATTKVLFVQALMCLGKTLFLTPHLLRIIEQRCPSVKTLIFEGAYVAKDIVTSDISLMDIPKTITTLSFRRSFFHIDQLLSQRPLSMDSLDLREGSSITCLDFGFCWFIEDNDAPFFTRLPQLRELHLNNCKGLSSRGIYTLSSSYLGQNFTVLNLENNKMLDDIINVLSGNCPNLVKLYMANTNFNERDLNCLKERPFLALREFCLRNLEVSDVGLHIIYIHQPKLSWVNITGTQVTVDVLGRFKKGMTDCTVICHKDPRVDCEHFLNCKI